MTSKLPEDLGENQFTGNNSTHFTIISSVGDRAYSLIGTQECETQDEIEFDEFNCGAPPEGAHIVTNSLVALVYVPQAWEDSHGNWFYNFAGALELASFLGKRLPTSTELMTYLDNQVDSLSNYPGYRDTHAEDFNGYGGVCDFWTSTKVSEFRICNVYLLKGSLMTKQEFSNPRHGLSVRLVSDKKPSAS